MHVDGSEHSLRVAVDSWLDRAAVNLCDAAKAELRDRLCVSTRERMEKLAADGMPADEALRQAVGELRDPSDSRTALEAKHLTKSEFNQVARFLAPVTRAQNLPWLTILGILALPIFFAPALIALLATPNDALGAFIGVFLAIAFSIGPGLVIAASLSRQRLVMHRWGPLLSRILWYYGRRQAISDISIGLLFLSCQLIAETRESTFDTIMYLCISLSFFISAFTSIYLKKKLVRKVTTLEADAFQYIVRPPLVPASQKIQPHY